MKRHVTCFVEKAGFEPRALGTKRSSLTTALHARSLYALWYLCLKEKGCGADHSQKHCEPLSTVRVSDLRPQYAPRKRRIKCTGMCSCCKSTWEKRYMSKTKRFQEPKLFCRNEQKYLLSSRSKLNGSWHTSSVIPISFVRWYPGVSF
jgi:hypothetical protein